MFQANLVSTALRPDQMAPGRVGLVVSAAHRTTFALVTFATLRRTLRDLQVKIRTIESKLTPLVGQQQLFIERA